MLDEAGAVKTVRVNVSTSGEEANRLSEDAAMSPDGRFVAFSSDATNLVPGDTNRVRDVFVRDRDTDRDGVFDEPGAVATLRVSVTGANEQADGLSSLCGAGAASPHWVCFTSEAANLGTRPDHVDNYLRGPMR
jgi:hypothetical protein